MTIIVDECLPNRLCKALVEHKAILVQKAGYGGLKDKELLAKIDGKYDVFITIDANLVYQQNLSNSHISLIVLSAKSNAFEDIEPLVPQILACLKKIKPAETMYIS